MEILEQWYFCETNFLLPCFIFISNPAFFLIVIFFFSLLGIIISFRKKSKRWNSFVLSLYPFIFHLCFMIFFWCSNIKVIIITELICLTTFLLGSIHHCITLIFEIVAFLSKLVKKMFKTNKIDPMK